MKTLFITSYLDLYSKDENGNIIAHNFGDKNKILTNLKKYVKKFDSMLMVASDEYNTDASDMYAKVIVDSFNMTLPFKNYTLLDCRNKNNATELVKNADFIFLIGGHVPTQNKFFNGINLKNLLKDFDGVVLGGSAGSMNCADVVYCPPELEGEGYDKNFERFLPGLSLTKINIFPHYDVIADVVLDGKKMIDYAIEDSEKIPVLILEDGSYFIQKGDDIKLYGKSYRLYKKETKVLCDDDQSVKIDENLSIVK